ncbi:hypothetical protein ONZ45_g14481 [Pleurotus djamor]|nr:hypothetical protein ONZ45_g14481 [Pleurotus djamor]
MAQVESEAPESLKPGGVEQERAEWSSESDRQVLSSGDHASNVIEENEDISSDESFASPLSQLSALPMTKKSSISSLKLHSPSQIVGTPFAVNTARYEYPFPETVSSSSSSGSGDDSPGLPQSLPTAMFSSWTSMSPPLTGFSTSPPSGTSSSFFASPKNAPHYPLSHPKLLLSDVDKEPPVPPGILKSRHRWSMGLLAKRKKRTASDDTVGSVRSTTSSESSDSVPSYIGRGLQSPQETPLNSVGRA